MAIVQAYEIWVERWSELAWTPVVVSAAAAGSTGGATPQVEALKPHRRRLPAERAALTHKFDITGHEGYITVGLYPDG